VTDVGKTIDSTIVYIVIEWMTLRLPRLLQFCGEWNRNGRIDGKRSIRGDICGIVVEDLILVLHCARLVNVSNDPRV
jgi:hypothetical protein